MCCITKAPKQKKSNEALYGESYICPASLSWVNTEFGEWQPTPLLSLTPYVASALLEAGWKTRWRVTLPMHTCKAQKSSHIYCTNYPPPHRHTVTPTPPYHSWNRKLSPSFPSKLLSLASHSYQNHTAKPEAQACTAKLSQNTLYQCKREVDFGRLTQPLRVWADSLLAKRSKRSARGE